MIRIGSQRCEFRLLIERNDVNAVDVLSDETGLPKQRVKLAMQRGAVWLTRRGSCRRLRRVKRALHVGDQLDLYYDERVLLNEPPVPLLIADEHAFSVWYKPHGMLSQGSRWGDHCTITRWAEQHLEPQRPAFVVHRLDRAATGLIMVGHTRKAAALLSERFRSRTIEKRYRVVVAGEFPETPSPYIVDRTIDGRAAISHLTRLGYAAGKGCSLLEVSIETGRKHQIRRHCAESGYPVVGDRLYGSGDDGEDLQLTACYLAFECPLTGRPRRYRLDEQLLPTL